jgi:hypothetical protein
MFQLSGSGNIFGGGNNNSMFGGGG